MDTTNQDGKDTSALEWTRILEDLKKLYAEAPAYGSVGLSLHFADSKLHRIEKSVSESLRTD